MPAEPEINVIKREVKPEFVHIVLWIEEFNRKVVEINGM